MTRRERILARWRQQLEWRADWLDCVLDVTCGRADAEGEA